MNLLREGERVPLFSLKTAGGEVLRYESLLRKRRIVLLLLSQNPGTGDNGRQWLANARKAAGQFKERDMTVLVLAADLRRIPELTDLSEPFLVLSDPDRTVMNRLGSAPAFYLVGKDTGIKQATRTAPELTELFALIDAMPMRRREMGG